MLGIEEGHHALSHEPDSNEEAYEKLIRINTWYAEQVALLAKRLIETVALARKAGQAVAGFEKVRARLREGDAGAVLAARDGAADGRAKIAAMAGESPVIAVLDGGELGLAFGRDSVIHAALDSGGLTDRVKREARRLDGFRQSG